MLKEGIRKELPPLSTDIHQVFTILIHSLDPPLSHHTRQLNISDECTLKFDFVDVDLLEGEERKAMVEEVKKVNERCSFPTIIIGEKVIVGYKEKDIKEALGL